MINKKINFVLMLILINISFANSSEQAELEVTAEMALFKQTQINNISTQADAIPFSPTRMTDFPTVAPMPIHTATSGCCVEFQTAVAAASVLCLTETGVGTGDLAAAKQACGQLKTIGRFTSGSSAEIFLQGINYSISVSGDKVAENIEKNGKILTSKMGEVTAGVVSTIGNFQENLKSDRLKRKTAMMNIKLNFLAEIKEREIRAKNAEFTLTDTAEEIAFIEYQLQRAIDEENENKSQVVIEYLKNKYDKNPDFVIPVKIKASDSLMASTTGEKCADYDPSTVGMPSGPNSCFYPQKSYPGKTLEIIFKECSSAKKKTLLTLKDDANKRVVRNSLKNEQIDSLNTIVSSRNTSSLQEVKRITSCNDKEYGFGLCYKDLEPSAYLEKVIKNEIIPNGGFSASNFLLPPVIGTYDGDVNVTPEEIKASLVGMLDKGGSEGENCNLWGGDFCGQSAEAVSNNTPDLVYTYKTSAQYFAAKDFISNLLNKNLIANQSIADRNKISSADFQSRFKQRAAALSLSETVLNSVIEKRIGTSIAEKVFDGEIKREDIIKENINGAGSLDILESLVKNDYDKLIVNSSGANSASIGQMEALSRMAPKNIDSWQLNAQILNTKLKFENKMQSEEIEILLAAYLGQKLNSPSNLNLMKKLKAE